MSGITSRALRHYDDVGLLHPARVASNGYRWYGRAELRRLQRILILRELGVPLPQVRQMLDGEADELASLRRHRRDLAVERVRLDQILATVDRTIADLEGTATLSDEEFFTGLGHRRNALQADLTSRFGVEVHEHFASATAATAGWTREDHQQAADQGRHFLRRLSQARTTGASPGDRPILDLMVEHYEGVRALWPANAAAYHALADVILDNPDQRAMIEDVDPDLPPWLAEAIRAYAIARLGFIPSGAVPVEHADR